MPSRDSPAAIVARFLKANGYTDTLEAFITETGLPPDAGSVEPGDLTVERILEEKRVFDASLLYEKAGAGARKGDDAWSLPAPSHPVQVPLEAPTNLLHVSIQDLSGLSDGGGEDVPAQVLCVTSADRRVRFLSLEAEFPTLRSLNHVQDSPVLSCVMASATKWVTISCGMSGQVLVYDHSRDEVVDTRRDHMKYVVRVATCERDGGCIWVATAGWDAKVLVYAIKDLETMQLGPPVGVLSLATNPESILFVEHPDSAAPLLLVSRTDSTSMLYYELPNLDDASIEASPVQLKLLGTQNLAPHANDWVAFSPSSIAVSPTDPTLLAVATSAMPHMKLILVRMLLPSLDSQEAARPARIHTQMRESLAIQDREEAAIQVHVSTMAPQTPFSTPQVVWRPDGTGVWINGDDGVLRGLEAKTGKIMATLKDGHEPGSKIRSIWCGSVTKGDRVEEWVVSGGFDRRLVVWKPDDNDGNSR